MTLGNRFTGLELDDQEEAFARRLAHDHRRHGIYFVGIDLAFPYVFELNLANPGGLNCSLRATGVDQTDEALGHLYAALREDDVL